ncbi:MFS transporter [Kitasatospora sp. NPDC002040]|uniref:MFS transporter n=1 Tax=Kitasatospora sp. NPDC002040 TaxID=3154661 RepID=UPI003326A146
MTTTDQALAPTPARNRLRHPDPTVRRLALVTLVNCLGNGLSMTLGVLFFTRVLGFGAVQVGTALTAAGLCGVLAGVPAGRAADRWGSRRVLVVLVTGEALGVTAYTLVHSYALFVPLACLVAALDRGSAAVRSALYAEVLPADKRVAGRAYLRVVTNVGIGAGTAVAALALHVDTRSAYVTAILADAVSFAAVALMYAALTVPPRVAAPKVVGSRGQERRHDEDRGRGGDRGHDGGLGAADRARLARPASGAGVVWSCPRTVVSGRGRMGIAALRTRCLKVIVMRAHLAVGRVYRRCGAR